MTLKYSRLIKYAHTIRRSLSKNEKNVVVYHLNCHACIARRDPHIRKAKFLPKTHHMQYVSLLRP